MVSAPPVETTWPFKVAEVEVTAVAGKFVTVGAASGSVEKEAEGLAQARLRQAEAEAQAIAQVAQAMAEHGNPAQYLITTRYIESLRDMTKSNNAKVIFMPVETSTMLSAVGTIKEMFSETGSKGPDDKQQAPPPPRQLR